MRRGAIFALIAGAALAAAPAATLAHGGEDEALEKTPAPALVQQALALLSQEDGVGEAQERVEAALKSEDRAGVDLQALRRAKGALGREDQTAATRLLTAALEASEGDGDEAAGDEGMAGEEDEEHAEEGQAADPADSAVTALEHTPEFEPERGTAQWVGVAAGAVLMLLGAGLLLRTRGREITD